MRRPIFIAALLSGAALGAAFTWQFHRPPPAAPAPVAPPAPPAARAETDPLAPRPLLTSREISSTIAAWLALPRTPGPRANYAVRAEALRALLSRLPAAEFPRLLDSILQLDDEARDGLRRLAFDTWIDLDPAAAARWAASGGEPTRNLARQAAKAWALRDGLAALAWITALTDDALATDLASYAIGQLPPGDLTRALSMIEARGPVFRDNLAAILFRPLAKTDPAAAVRAFGPTMWHRGTEIWQLDNALAAWARTDLDGALGWLAAQPRANEFPSIAARLGTDDASRTRLASALLARADFPMRQATLGKLISDWAEKSPSAALAWINTMDDDDLRDRILERATRSYDPDTPGRDLTLVLARVASEARDSSVAFRLELWAKKSPQEALAWIATQSDPSVANAAPRVHGAVLGALAVESPEAAVREWGAIFDPATRTAALGPIVDAWARTAPEAALRWGTENLLASGQTSADWQALPLQTWVTQAPTAALAWIESQPTDLARRSLLYSLDRPSQNNLPPDRVAQLYSQIQNPELRTSVLTPQLQNWMRRDPAAAKVWITAHPELGIKKVE